MFDLVPDLKAKVTVSHFSSQVTYLLRVTHLHHQNKKIYQIGDLSPVKNLTVLYLYNNRLERLERLESVPKLQMLYLQKNKIQKISGLEHLTSLRKLYLSRNRISVIENLNKLPQLEELHVDRQNLEPHQNLVFDPRTCHALSKSLCTLNTSHNRMLRLSPLQECQRLKRLNVSGNLLEHFHADVLPTIAKLRGLEEVDTRLNPFTATEKKHWEHLIAACEGDTVVVDGKTVHETNRALIKCMRRSF